MTRDEFERHIEDALAALPDKVLSELRNVAFVVEDTAGDGGSRPGAEDGGDCELLGLYEGVPRSEYAGDPSGMLPDKITLFKDVIEEDAEETGDDVAAVIRHTVWHEVAHYFGFDEDGARRLETKWEDRFSRRHSHD